MNNMMFVLLSFLTCTSISNGSQEKVSEVAIISTIHGAHKINPNYTYDSLFQFIERFNPDLIGVEIREEDMDSSFVYLKSNYPFEMYQCIEKFPDKNVMGFDWLGKDLEGRAIPANYWKDSSVIKKLQQQLNADSAFLSKLSILQVIEDEKNKLVLNASLRELNDGRYDLINHIYYEQLRVLLETTEYQSLSDFYRQRDERIAQNILKIIKMNKGKRMIFLLGADHRYHTMEKVANSEHMPDGIENSFKWE